jgi:hypothetical protein
MTSPSTPTSTIRRICTDDFGIEWFEIQKPGYVTQRFPAFVHGTWLQHAKYPYKGLLMKTMERDVWSEEDFVNPRVWLGKRIEDVWVMGWTQVCSVETYIHWGLVSQEQVEAVGFKLRW